MRDAKIEKPSAQASAQAYLTFYVKEPQAFFSEFQKRLEESLTLDDGKLIDSSVSFEITLPLNENAERKRQHVQEPLAELEPTILKAVATWVTAAISSEENQLLEPVVTKALRNDGTLLVVKVLVPLF